MLIIMLIHVERYVWLCAKGAFVSIYVSNFIVAFWSLNKGSVLKTLEHNILGTMEMSHWPSLLSLIFWWTLWPLPGRLTVNCSWVSAAPSTRTRDPPWTFGQTWWCRVPHRWTAIDRQDYLIVNVLSADKLPGRHLVSETVNSDIPLSDRWKHIKNNGPTVRRTLWSGQRVLLPTTARIQQAVLL